MRPPEARLRVPETAAPGDIVEIRTMLTHPMETGLRRQTDGTRVPRRIVARVECQIDGETVFACHLSSSVAANPFLSFPVRIDRTGRVEVRWYDQDGSLYSAGGTVTVVP